MENLSSQESQPEKFKTMYNHILVSSCGRVFTKDRMKHSFSRGGAPYSCEIKGKELKTRKDKDGYLRFNTTVGQKHITVLVHRLMASTFLGDCPEGFVVDHIDRDKTNNRVENLRYASHATNVRNADRHKMTDEKKQLAIKMRGVGVPTSAIARALNVQSGSIKYFFRSLVDVPHFERNV